MLLVQDKVHELRIARADALTKPDKDVCNKSMQARCRSEKESVDGGCLTGGGGGNDDVRAGEDTEDSYQRDLMIKCLKLLTRKHVLEIALSHDRVIV